MRLPRAEVVPWAHGHYERKALRPGREGAAAGPRWPQQRQPARPRPAGPSRSRGPMKFPHKFEWKRHGVSGPAWAVGLSAVVLASGRFAPVTRARAQQANVSW